MPHGSDSVSGSGSIWGQGGLGPGRGASIPLLCLFGTCQTMQ